MGYNEYNASMQLELKAHLLREETGANQFYSLLMAAMRVADSDNFELLKSFYPIEADDLQQRRNAPGGVLKHEREY